MDDPVLMNQLHCTDNRHHQIIGFSPGEHHASALQKLFQRFTQRVFRNRVDRLTVFGDIQNLGETGDRAEMGDFFIHLKEIAEIGFKLDLTVGTDLDRPTVSSAGDQCFGEKFSDRDLAVGNGIVTDICNAFAIIGKDLSDQITAANQGTRGKAGLDARRTFRVTAVRTDAEIAFVFHAAHAQILVHPFSFLSVPGGDRLRNSIYMRAKPQKDCPVKPEVNQ